MMDWQSPYANIKYVIDLFLLEFQTTTNVVDTVVHKILDKWEPQTYIDNWVFRKKYFESEDGYVYKSEKDWLWYENSPDEFLTASKSLVLEVEDWFEGNWSAEIKSQNDGRSEKWMLWYGVEEGKDELIIESSPWQETGYDTKEISKFEFWSELTRMLNKFDNF